MPPDGEEEQGAGAAPPAPEVYVDGTRLLAGGLARYFNGAFADITVIAPDGRALGCHQVVLSAGSRRFANMLEQGNLAGEELPVWGVDSDALEAIIRFFYTAECTLSHPGAVAVLDAANRLDVPALAEAAGRYVRAALAPGTAASLLGQALHFKVTDLADACVAFIDARFEEVAASPDFAGAAFGTLAHVLRGLADSQGELSLFRAAWRWIVADVRHVDHLEDILGLVKVPSISFNELIALAKGGEAASASPAPGGSPGPRGALSLRELQAAAVQGLRAAGVDPAAAAALAAPGGGWGAAAPSPGGGGASGGAADPLAAALAAAGDEGALLAALGGGGLISPVGALHPGALAPGGLNPALGTPSSGVPGLGVPPALLGSAAAAAAAAAAYGLALPGGDAGDDSGGPSGGATDPRRLVSRYNDAALDDATGSGRSGSPAGAGGRMSTRSARGDGSAAHAVAAAAASAGRTSHAKGVCQVEGCGTDLRGLRDYHLRYKICEYHLKVSSIIRDGKQQRFCQQCGRFHLLSDFDGAKRSCRARLQRHNARRRKRGDDEPAASTPSSAPKRGRGSASHLADDSDGGHASGAGASGGALGAGGGWADVTRGMSGGLDPLGGPPSAQQQAYMAAAMAAMGGAAAAAAAGFCPGGAFGGGFGAAGADGGPFGPQLLGAMAGAMGAMAGGSGLAGLGSPRGGAGEALASPGGRSRRSSGALRARAGSRPGSAAGHRKGEALRGGGDSGEEAAAQPGDGQGWAAGLEMLADVAQLGATTGGGAQAAAVKQEPGGGQQQPPGAAEQQQQDAQQQPEQPEQPLEQPEQQPEQPEQQQQQPLPPEPGAHAAAGAGDVHPAAAAAGAPQPSPGLFPGGSSPPPQDVLPSGLVSGRCDDALPGGGAASTPARVKG
ncbi:SPL3 [Scenedesmus sp. PABB004]|nr:SPL3 [Scenedesmus sp. PABB004]